MPVTLRRLGVYFVVCTRVRDPWVVLKNQLGWLAPGEQTLELRNGLRFRCRNNTPDSNEAVVISLANEYPPAFLQRLPPRGTVIDLGGYIGTFAVVASRLRPDLTVHSYEPSSQNVRLLMENLKLNGTDRHTVVHRVAVSERDGRVRLSVGGSPDRFHVLPDAAKFSDENEAVEDVPARSLQSISGYLAIPILLIAIALRDQVAIGLLAASLSLSLTAVAVYLREATPRTTASITCAPRPLRSTGSSGSRAGQFASGHGDDGLA